MRAGRKAGDGLLLSTLCWGLELRVWKEMIHPTISSGFAPCSRRDWLRGGLVRRPRALLTRCLCLRLQDVIKVSKQYLQGMAVGYSSPKLTLRIGDGFEFMQQNQEAFDVIITDSSDPVGKIPDDSRCHHTGSPSSSSGLSVISSCATSRQCSFVTALLCPFPP